MRNGLAVELILIRHGESEANAGTSTDPDCALSPRGVEQAHQLAGRLAGYDLSGFAGLSSPYRRARQTAEIIGAATGLCFTADAAVREWGPAAKVGGTVYPLEAGHELIERIRQFLRRREGQRLLIVSHAAPISAMTRIAWGEVPDTHGPFWQGIGNCCIRWLKSTCSDAEVDNTANHRRSA